MYGLRGMYYYGFDWTYLLVIAGLVISLIVQGVLRSTYSKYLQVPSQCGYTGASAAQRLLQNAGIYDVRVTCVSGSLSDHYDPGKKLVCLSESNYSSTSLAALGVAAHECGHAIQHQKGYAPLKVRTALVPVVNIASFASWPIFIIGLIMSIRPLLWAGIICFCGALVFQLVTLPVEFDASRRALVNLESSGILGRDEVGGSRKVLRAAAMTYVASVLATFLQVLRLVILAGGGRNRD